MEHALDGTIGVTTKTNPLSYNFLIHRKHVLNLCSARFFYQDTCPQQTI